MNINPLSETWPLTIQAASAAGSPADIRKLLQAVQPYLLSIKEPHATVTTTHITAAARGFLLTDQTRFPDTQETYESVRWLSYDVLLGRPTSPPEEALHGHQRPDHREATGFRFWKRHDLADAAAAALKPAKEPLAVAA